MLAWFVARHPDFRLQSVSLHEWAIALVLIVAGQVCAVPEAMHACMRAAHCAEHVPAMQVLNLSIYRAIGQDGVYYGIRLGKQIPWCDSFPFNIVSHPQYVGSIMTVWGAFCLTLEQQNQSGSFRLAWFWSMLYITTLVTEESA